MLVTVALAAGASGMLGGDREGRPPDGAGSREATVTRVVDGDTAILSGLGRSRFIGIDTPEVHGRRECFGAQASAFVKRELTGRRVRYAMGAEPRDRYGRALVYIWLPDGRFLNELLVAEGFAVALTIAPNVRYARRFRDLADRARAKRLGLWSPRTCGGHVDLSR